MFETAPLQSLLDLPDEQYTVRQIGEEWQIERVEKGDRYAVVSSWLYVIQFAYLLMVGIMFDRVEVFIWFLIPLGIFLYANGEKRAKKLTIKTDHLKLRIMQQNAKHTQEVVVAWADRPTFSTQKGTVIIDAALLIEPIHLYSLTNGREAKQLCTVLTALAKSHTQPVLPPQLELFPVEGLMPGVSRRGTVLRLGRLWDTEQKMIDAYHFRTITPTASFHVTLDDNTVEALIFDRNDQLPDHWRFLGLGQDVPMNHWRERLPQYGFQFIKMEQQPMPRILEDRQFDPVVTYHHKAQNLKLRVQFSLLHKTPGRDYYLYSLTVSPLAAT